MKKDPFGCRVSCTGLYADVSFNKGNPEDTTLDEEDLIMDTKIFSKLIKDYKDFKQKFARNLIFNSTSPGLGAQFKYLFYFINHLLFTTHSLFILQPHRKKMRSTSLRSSLTHQPTTRWNRTRG